MSVPFARRSVARKRIAFLTPSNPVEADTGGKQFTFDRLISLSRLAEVDVFCLQDTSEQRQRLSKILEDRPVFSAGELKPRTIKHWVESLMAGIPLSVWRNDVKRFSQLIKSHSSTHYDAIYIDHWLMWPASLEFSDAVPRILNLHNAEHMIFERAAQSQSGMMKLILMHEARRVRRYLRDIGGQATAVHAISEADRHELAAIGIPSSRISTILPCVESNMPPSGKAGGKVLFAGTLSWPPNIEGVEWFLRHVLPDLNVSAPVQVVGGDPLSSWRSLPAAGKAEFLGRVPSVEPLYAEAGVLIAPVFSGSGIKLKIVNALARGLPVVTTTCGIEGFPPGWEGAVKVCDDPVNFGRAIQSTIEDTKSWYETSRYAKQYAMQHFSTAAAQAKLEECLNACTRR